MPKATMPNDHPQAAVELPDGATVERGKTADVDDDTAASLAEQGWSVATDDVSKDDLIAQAAALGVEVKASWSKQKIADAIAEAPTTDASPDADTKES